MNELSFEWSIRRQPKKNPAEVPEQKHKDQWLAYPAPRAIIHLKVLRSIADVQEVACIRNRMWYKYARRERRIATAGAFAYTLCALRAHNDAEAPGLATASLTQRGLRGKQFF